MSWSGFKKNVGRATTQVMMKTGHVEKTNDREYEVEERRYRTLESASLRLQKEARGYLDSLRAMTASQMRIAETIDAFYGDSGARDGVSRSYKQAVEDLDAETVKALDGPYRYIQSRDLHLFWDEDAGAYNMDLKTQIESELNFASKRRDLTRHFTAFLESLENTLIENVYRTTVLEPINRFCAYFADINECIKKRNHKMLDYDAMRAKVKKLVEKPDKDPTKLPRAEKETEMVGIATPFRSQHPQQSSSQNKPQQASALHINKRVQAAKEEEEEIVARLSGMRSDSRNAGKRDGKGRAPSEESQPHHRPSPAHTTTSFFKTNPTPKLPLQQDSPVENHRSYARSRGSKSSKPGPPTKYAGTSNIHPIVRPGFRDDFLFTPFFGPSDLEDALRPHMQDYVKRQTDLYAKAKAAYEQLNEQLTNELPQLIDLRVPYLDPSFEALVKIQLRFCAEAYSRMAQVQQYLDASTRDQYASGDLDARVEDVLGQIRELSIAGTV